MNVVVCGGEEEERTDLGEERTEDFLVVAHVDAAVQSLHLLLVVRHAVFERIALDVEVHVLRLSADRHRDVTKPPVSGSGSHAETFTSAWGADPAAAALKHSESHGETQRSESNTSNASGPEQNAPAVRLAVSGPDSDGHRLNSNRSGSQRSGSSAQFKLINFNSRRFFAFYEFFSTVTDINIRHLCLNMNVVNLFTGVNFLF